MRGGGWGCAGAMEASASGVPGGGEGGDTALPMPGGTTAHTAAALAAEENRPRKSRRSTSSPSAMVLPSIVTDTGTCREGETRPSSSAVVLNSRHRIFGYGARGDVVPRSHR